MKTIEEYITFALDNKLYEDVIKKYYIFKDVEWNYMTEFNIGIHTDICSLEKLITSKEFIEAITRGLCKKPNNAQIRLYCQSNNLSDIITKRQAFAIRDWKLEEYITNLLK